jgi:hypothetical protein
VVAFAFEPLEPNESIEGTTRERRKLKLATVVIEKEEGAGLEKHLKCRRRPAPVQASGVQLTLFVC